VRELSNFFTKLGLAATFTISSSFLGLPKPKEASAQQLGYPVAILVDGYGDCCAWKMQDVRSALTSLNAEVYTAPWNSLYGASQSDNPLNDARFLKEVAEYVNNIPPNRPVILIGHSFGGDSLLKVAHRINRRILFLGVLDPVALGGQRAPIRNYGVPSNVDFFFNRYQTTNVWPIENRIPGANEDGTVQNCAATVCDQQEQSLARNADGSEIRVNCPITDPTCPGFRVFPPRAGTAARRLQHEDVPTDAYIQSQIIERMTTLLANY
jgi:pimeloyl-ACP methyl ester carboxylesterase